MNVSASARSAGTGKMCRKGVLSLPTRFIKKINNGAANGTAIAA
jgi:hypothetical protein